MAINDTDLMLVSDGTNTETVTIAQVRAQTVLNDSDKFVINDGSKTETVTWLEMKNDLGPSAKAPSVDGATLTGTGAGFSGQTYTTTLTNYDPGVPAATQTMKARVTGALSVVGETSAITGIDEQPEVTLGVLSLGGAASDGKAVFTDPDTQNYIWSNTNNTITFNGDPIPVKAGQKLQLNAGTESARRIKVTINTDTGSYETDRVDLPIINKWNEVNSANVAEFDIIADGTLSQIVTDTGSSNGGLVKVMIDGVKVLSNSVIEEGYANLTLTDRKDLDNGLFEVGDAVTGYSTGGVVNPVVFAAQPGGTDAGVTNPGASNYAGKAFDGGTGSYGVMAAANLLTPITYSTSVEVMPAGNIGGCGINRGLSDEVEATFTGEVNGIWQTVASGSGTIKSFNASVGVGATNIYAWRVDGVVVIANGVDEVKVVNINQSSPEMTVSGGTWSVGQTVKNTVARAPVITPTTDEITAVTKSGGGSFPTATLTQTGNFGTVTLPIPGEFFTFRIAVTGNASPAYPEIGFSPTPFTGTTYKGDVAGFYFNDTNAETGAFLFSAYNTGSGVVNSVFPMYADDGTPLVLNDSNRELEFIVNSSGNVWIKHQGRLLCAAAENTDPPAVDPDSDTGPLIINVPNGSNIGFLSRNTTSATATINPEQTVLTFSTDKDLGNFDGGDSVAQDSGYQPVTSEITATTNTVTDYSSGCSLENGATTTGGTLGGCFQNGGKWGVSVQWGAKIVFNPPLTGKTEFYCEQATTGNMKLRANGDTEVGTLGSVDGRQWLGDGFTGTLNYIEFGTSSPSGVAQLFYPVKNNGTNLIDGQPSTILTLTDRKDLANFRVGDVLGGFTDDEAITSSPGGSIIYRNGPGYTDSNPLTINDFQTYGGIKTAQQSASGNYGTKQYELTLDSALNTDGDAEFFVECWFYKATGAGTYPFVGNVSPFNFHGSSGLANTVVGGYISSASHFLFWKGTSTTVHQRPAVSTGTAFADLGEGWHHIAWYINNDGTNIYCDGSRVGGENLAGTASPDPTTRATTGWSNTYSSNAGYCPNVPIACVRFSQGNPYGTPASNNFIPLGLDSDQWEVSDKVKLFMPMSTGDGVNILNIKDDSAPYQMTVDAQKYSVGQTVVGPEFEAATGTVGSTDSAAKTMTLSASDESNGKRWIVNAGKKVVGPTGPATKSTAYLTWNGTAVNGLSTVDPGYAAVPTNLELTFTDPAPTGQTWDQELPAGTSIATRVVATNTEGSADTDWTTAVTPRFLREGDHFGEAFAEETLRMATFENRAAVYQGEQAMAKREALRQQMVAAGASPPAIDKLLGGTSK